MTNELSTALLLLVVGMITVFSILSLVVLSGNVLIRLVNRFAPQSPVKTSAKSKRKQVTGIAVSEQAIPAAKIAAITAVVELVTKGEGRIESIKKS